MGLTNALVFGMKLKTDWKMSVRGKLVGLAKTNSGSQISL